MSKAKSCPGKAVLRFAFAAFFVGVGVTHFTRTKRFTKIVPKSLPNRKGLVYASGLFEIVGGVGLLVPATRKFSGNGLIALLAAVFPANVNMATNNINFGFIPRWVLWARLPLQWALIKGAYKLSRD